MKKEFSDKVTIWRLAATFAGNPAPGRYRDSDERELYFAAKAEGAGFHEALFVVASIASKQAIDCDPKTLRDAQDAISAIFDSHAYEFMGYREFFELSSEIAGVFADRLNDTSMLLLFRRFAGKKRLVDVCL